MTTTSSRSGPVATAPGVSDGLRLSPLQLEDLIALRLRDVCAGIADWKQLLTVVGRLGDLPAARYGGGRIYRLPLLDPDSAGAITYLNVREAVLEQAHAEPGDLVRATGLIVPELFKGVVSFRLEVVAIEHETPAAAVPRVREATAATDLLRRLAIERRPFPATAQPTVTLIHPAASQAQVADDFLGAVRPSITTDPHRVPVSMHDPAAIAAALRGVRTDVVALIRGGGDAAGFAVFEDPQVLEALAACRAYRVLGLGHTANRTLAEIVADHAASTPTAAGEHLGRRIAEAGQQLGMQGRIADLHETLARRDMELAQARRATLPAVPEPPAPPRVPEPDLARQRWTIPGWVWAILGAAAAWAVFNAL